jgi:lipopolysaccharide export system ATP-binding protein
MGDAGTQPTPTSNSVLEATGLRKRYGRREVVRGAGLTVNSAEIVGLLGPNGAGKTTCFYMIVGLVGADKGDITIDGKSIVSFPMHKRAQVGVGYLPQEASVFKRLSVRDNIVAVLELQKDPTTGKTYKRTALLKRLEELLLDLQITHIASSSAASLSGGERRRVEIARALACNPRFMLLDEPFAGVDPIAVIEIQRIVRFLKERGIGVLITDHNVRETLGIVDRAYIISEGQVLATGTPTELINNETVRKVYLGEHFTM